MKYKVKLVSGEYGVEEFTYDTITEQRLGAARLQIAAHEHHARDGIYREVVICIGEEPEYGEEVERL
jgi:hypothetical protein